MLGKVSRQGVKSVRLLQYKVYQLIGLSVGMCNGRDLDGWEICDRQRSVYPCLAFLAFACPHYVLSLMQSCVVP